ncbi:sensor histidine kinase, partial [Streptomyces sp.]|uniref:sensor histidine kinase n=1 Tax=Streptomyces sp. TaxID=1931 RepID=UPI002F959832
VAHPGLTVTASAVTAARLHADERGLRRVLRNLGDNAARHARGRVALDLATAQDGRIVLGVEDDGPGVPADQRERIFERFVRLDDARDRADGDASEGSGLGLAIVAELVAAHGGDVRAVDGETLGGARFEVTLPAADTPPAELL